jgi:hypothetical protein
LVVSVTNAMLDLIALSNEPWGLQYNV